MTAPEREATVEAGQRVRVDLSLGDPGFCQIPPILLFANASSFVSPAVEHKRAYSLVLQRLNGGGGRLVVVGHTDDVGRPDNNKALSERRARAALAVLTGAANEWESIFATEREHWPDNVFRDMLNDVGDSTDDATVRQHREMTPVGLGRRSSLFRRYFQKLLSEPASMPMVALLSPSILGCGEHHTLGTGDHPPSRRAEFFFFLVGGTPAVDCSHYTFWRNPCAPIPLPTPSVVNAFFVSGAGDNTTGDGTQTRPWRTIAHSLLQMAILRQPEPATLHVLPGTYDDENVSLPGDTTLQGEVPPQQEGPVRTLPFVRGAASAVEPVFRINGIRNCVVRSLNITRGRNSGIRIESSQNITVTDCEIDESFAPRGGGIAIRNSQRITLENNTIERNVAGTIATAVRSADIEVSISREITRFEIDIGDAHGGGVYVENSEAVTIARNRIRENTAILFGGGIAIDNRPQFDSVVTIIDNTINCNQCAHGDLGPLLAPDIICSSIDIHDPLQVRLAEEVPVVGEEVGRRATLLLHGVGLESGMGGGIALRHVSPQTRITANRIGASGTPNRARRGGGIECFTGADPTILDNVIQFNLASDDGGGVAIDHFDPFLPRSEASFLGFRRGPIFPRRLIRMNGNTVRSNRCISDGGGLYATGNVPLEIRGPNASFEENRAGENGGGIRVSYAARLTVVGATIAQNQANTIGAERDGGGGLAARNAIVRLEDCGLSGNIANNFAGGALFFTSAFEGGFGPSGFVGNRSGQFDEIMRDDYGFGARQYSVIDCRGSGNRATGPSSAGGFMYCVRVEGDLAVEASIRGARTAIGQNTSEFERNGNRNKRGNVVMELSGQLRAGQPEDRFFIAADVPSVAAGGIVASTPPPDNHPVVVIRGGNLPIDHPTVFPFFLGAPPAIINVQPRFGAISGGTEITITGQNFMSEAVVSIGGSPAEIIRGTDTSITARTPPGALGDADVVVRNPDSQSDTVARGFEYVLPPRILDLQPRSGSVMGRTPITITGTGFRPDVRVFVGGRPAPQVTLETDTRITAQTPPSPGLSGRVNVEVRNVDDQSDTVQDGFEYVFSQPRIFNIQPRSGPSTLGVPLTVTGDDFLPGAELLIDGQNATRVTVQPPGQINATTPVLPGRAGLVDVMVQNPDGQFDRISGGYEVIPPPPRIIDVDPRTGPVAGGIDIKITGTGFRQGVQVIIGSSVSVPATFVSNSEIHVTLPAGSAGAVDVVVRNPDGQSERVSSGFIFL